MENHFHTGATHDYRASETSLIPEIPIAQIHEQNRNAPFQDPIAQLQNYNDVPQRAFHSISTSHTRFSPAPQTSPHSQLLNHHQHSSYTGSLTSAWAVKTLWPAITDTNCC